MRYLRAIAFALCLCLLPSVAARSAEVPWGGVYEFNETAGHAEEWVYDLQLTPRGGGYTATLDVDGFQTMIRFHCDVHVHGNVARIYFRATDLDNMGHAYPPGTLLLTLVRSADGQLFTRWGKMRPNLRASLLRPVAFVRVGSP